MSEETREWLSQNILVGFTEARGNAWHHRKGDDNHYPQQIPIEEVKRRLFDWEPVKVETEYWRHDEACLSGEFIYTSSKTGEKICATTESHLAHSYSEWLLDNVGTMLGGEVQIGSAGLLKNASQAWVQVELAETQMASGVEFRPTILASTSLDQSLRSTYRAVNTIVVCDNTRAAALQEDTPVYGVKHTKNSKFSEGKARETIGLQLHQQAETFTAQVERMLSEEVTDGNLERLMEVLVPLADNPRGLTRAENKRDQLRGMWVSDPRVSIWKNTVWGVLQLFNTYNIHESSIRGENRVQSQLQNILSGKLFDKDAIVASALRGVLTSA